MQGWDSLPDKYLPNVNSIVTNNPGYIIMRWDDKGIREALRKYSCEVDNTTYLDKYNSLTLLHQRVDFARYFILYIYGGVSADTDAMAIKGFDTLPEIKTDNFIVSKNSSNLFINNATILVSEKNPLLKELLDSIDGDCSSYGSDFMCVTNTTGPTKFTEFVNDHRDQITVLDNSFFEPCSGYDKECSVEGIKENTILDHQHEGSWVPPGVKNTFTILYFCKRHWSLLLMLILIIILIFLLIRK